jgi:hypothetical protein
VAGVLHKSLALNASDRPSSAAEMRQMLREYEKYADLADVAAKTVVMDTSALGRPTRLTSDDTQPPPVSGQTDVKTEILPGALSQVTSVKNDGGDQKTNVAYAMTSAAPPIKRRIGIPVIALLLLLVGGVAAGGLYLMDPTMFGMGPAEKAAEQPSTVPPPANAAPGTSPDTSQLLSGSAEVTPDANAAQAETSRQTGTANKTGEITKNGKTAQTAKKNSADGGDNSDVTMNDGDVPEDVVITQRDRNGKLRTIHVNPNFRPPNVPNIPPDQYYPFPPGFDPGKEMTPAERRQLRELIRKRNANVQPPN